MASTGSSPFVAGTAGERNSEVVTMIRSGDELVNVLVLA